MSETVVEPEEQQYSNPDVLNQDPYELPLDILNPAQGELFEHDMHWRYFERLRNEAPVHYCPDSMEGPYWSITKYDDIMEVDTNHKVFSSEPSIVLGDPPEDLPLKMFIAMDQPKHTQQRKVASPVVAPPNLAELEPTIRKRVQNILDSLPIGEDFNWVEKVSIELTTQMLATLFDFPFEDRYKLTRWSDVATAEPGAGIIETEEEGQAELLECLEYFGKLWEERSAKPPSNDLVSMLAHGESTKNMEPMELLGNLVLLIVGGNDTTRNSISGGVLALNLFPDEYQKLRDDRSLIPNMASEIIRWQTPLAYMRRTAKEDVIFKGQQIKAGDKVAMWYVSGNRDPEKFDNPNSLVIDRPDARRHISFGFGIHRCMGNRLAELQLRILWEEIMQRFHKIEVTGDPVRVRSPFVKGYTQLPVRIHSL